MPNPTSKLNLVINGATTQLDIHDANAVDLTNNQTVGGIKTFSNAPVVGSINLDGKSIDTDANDNMTFNGHIVDTIEEQGEGYIRYSNGIQICWGLGEYSNNTTITYPRTFIAPNMMSVQVNCGIPNVTVGATNWFAESFLLSISTASAWVSWLAIGRWK